MNIFVLDKDPYVSATMMCDKHVVKMILESCQLLSTAHHVLDGKQLIKISKNGRTLHTYEKDVFHKSTTYLKCTMINHPCNVWVRKTSGNYRWLFNHLDGLQQEYTKRYFKTHALMPLIYHLLWYKPATIKDDLTVTDFVQAMPDQYKDPDPVYAYQQYYINEKSRFAKWKTEIPAWYTEGINNLNTVQT